MTLTLPHDVICSLGALLAGCGAAIDVDSSAVMVAVHGRLELLAASSHEPAELELHQLAAEEGPCRDAYEDGTSADVADVDEVRRRWPRLADSMDDSSYAAVRAVPLTFNGRRIGAMGLFRASAETFSTDEDTVVQAFAAIAASLAVHTADLPTDDVERRLRDALHSRVVVEQAKGVLADSQHLSMADAYAELVRSAHQRGSTLRERAVQVIGDARRR